MFYTYVIQHNITGRIYIGHTNNVEKRVSQHNDASFKKKSYTKLNKGKGKWVLVYSESFQTRKEAMKREKELKSSRGRNFIKTKILGR